MSIPLAPIWGVSVYGDNIDLVNSRFAWPLDRPAVFVDHGAAPFDLGP
jgi:hypothetical protein